MAEQKVDSSGQVVQPRMLTHWGDGATALTNRDISADLAKPGTPVIYNVAVTLANTEYNQALPASTKAFLIRLRDGSSFRLAFETGKVATPTEPYLTVPADMHFSVPGINASSLTLYFASPVATKTAEIVAWT